MEWLVQLNQVFLVIEQIGKYTVLNGALGNIPLFLFVSALFFLPLYHLTYDGCYKGFIKYSYRTLSIQKTAPIYNKIRIFYTKSIFNAHTWHVGIALNGNRSEVAAMARTDRTSCVQIGYFSWFVHTSLGKIARKLLYYGKYSIYQCKFHLFHPQIHQITKK